MRQSHRRFSDLSDPLPINTTPSICQPLHSTSISVHSILSSLELETHTLQAQSTYQEIVHFFRSHPQATGVLIIETTNQIATKPIGLLSRHRFSMWQLQQSQWQHALKQPLPAIPHWWQETLSYLLIDDQMLIKDAIALLLERPTCSSQEPVVVQSTNGIGLLDASQLLAAYARLVRSEQTSFVSQDVEHLRRQHQLILEAVGEGVYGVDLQGKVTFVNPAAAQMIGWEVQDLIGQSMHQILHHSKADLTPYPKEECPIYAAFHDGIIHRVSDEIFWRKDGSNFSVEYISTPMRDEQGQLIGAVVAFRDITQRKWAEAVLYRANEELEQMVRERTSELHQANEQLKELSELRSRVVSTVCHEFRNPLNTILFSVSSLERYETQLLPDQKEKYLVGIKENVERMTQMIDAILVIGKVEARGIEVQPSKFDLIQFCRTLIAEIRPDTNQIEFISRAKQLIVTLDEKLLRSILINILSNSIRYSPECHPIQFKVQRQNEQIVFQIKDQGIGIPATDLPYLFEPFHRGRNVSNIPGTGLGLNIVKRFVDLQQGAIEVKSKLGVGTTFTFTLPQHIQSYLNSIDQKI